MKTRQVKLGLLTLAVASVASLAYANQAHEKNDATRLGSAKLSLVQAVERAEQKVGGKAVKGELDQEANALSYEIEVVDGDQVQDVRVDANTGEILSARADKVDEDHESDSEGERDAED